MPGHGFVGDDVQGIGASELRIACCGGAEDFVAGDIHHDDVIADESEAIGAGREFLVADFEMDFIEQVGLVGLLNGGGIPGGVDQ